VKKKFKNDNGVWFKKALFFETCPMEDRYLTLYTLKDEDITVDGIVYKSLYRLYMTMEDIHEVEFSNTYLGGYKHLKHLCEAQWFLEHINEWREELELLLMSKGFKKLKQALDEDERGALVASKYFLDRAWDEGIHNKPTVKRGRGRPNKQALQSKVVEHTSSVSVLEDYKRLIKAN
jgi:PHD/YefM family antitoxin component YafN of YafNO toxin-antitoxin module